MESDLVKITKLKNIENWNVWKFQVRLLLISHEVFGVVNGTERKPATPAEGAVENVQAQYAKDLKA